MVPIFRRLQYRYSISKTSIMENSFNEVRKSIKLWKLEGGRAQTWECPIGSDATDNKLHECLALKGYISV